MGHPPIIEAKRRRGTAKAKRRGARHDGQAAELPARARFGLRPTGRVNPAPTKTLSEATTAR